MRLHKFSGVDAFVALDLPGAEASSGPVRWARKVLQGGAKDLARSQTYTYAALQMHRSGASAGISAEAPDRAEAIAAFVAEAAALVPDGTYLPDAAKGVSDQDLEPLRDGDPRTVARFGAFGAACDALSAAAAADAAVGLDGRTAVIEGFSDVGAALAQAVAERGGRVVGAASTEGSLASPDGLDPDALAEAWAAHGAKALSALAGGTDLDKPETLWDHPADIVFAGSKMGVVHHGVAEGLGLPSSGAVRPSWPSHPRRWPCAAARASQPCPISWPWPDRRSPLGATPPPATTRSAPKQPARPRP